MYKVKSLIRKTKTTITDLEKRVNKALDTTASDVNQRYHNVTRNWRTPVTFATETPFPYGRKITTQSAIMLYNDDGTKPHRINPRRKKFLHFYWQRQGRYVFSRGVNHPGTKAKNITKKIALAIQPILEQNIADALTEV